VSPSCTAANDVIDMDEPIIQVNVGNMLMKIMQDYTSWTATQFLESLQQIVFSVWFDSQGLPDAYLCMTPRMRSGLIRFGDVMFLDAQQHQFRFPLHLS
jgi:hypothetical protein